MNDGMKDEWIDGWMVGMTDWWMNDRMKDE